MLKNSEMCSTERGGESQAGGEERGAGWEERGGEGRRGGQNGRRGKEGDSGSIKLKWDSIEKRSVCVWGGGRGRDEKKRMKRGRMEGMCRESKRDKHPGENDAIMHTVLIVWQHIIELIQHAQVKCSLHSQ